MAQLKPLERAQRAHTRLQLGPKSSPGVPGALPQRPRRAPEGFPEDFRRVPAGFPEDWKFRK